MGIKRARTPVVIAKHSNKASTKQNQDVGFKNTSTEQNQDVGVNYASWEPNKGMSSPDSPMVKPNNAVTNSCTSSKLKKKLQSAENNIAEGCDENAVASSPDQLQESFNLNISQQDWGIATNYLYMARNPLSFIDLKLGRSSQEVKAIINRYFCLYSFYRTI